MPPKTLRDFTVHIGIATAVAILIAVLAFGRTAGSYEAQVRSNTKKIEEFVTDVKKIPLLEQAIENVREDVNHIRSTTDDIKNFLIKKK